MGGVVGYGMILDFEGQTPSVHASAFIAKGAMLIGDVEVDAEASIWFNAVLRGDVEPIRVGSRSNVQDGAVLHTDPGCPCIVGKLVTVGHNAILHGCEVADEAMIGMGATVLNRAKVGKHALVAANALVLEDTVIPEGTLVAGVPAKPRRELTEEEIEGLRQNSLGYISRREPYMQDASG